MIFLAVVDEGSAKPGVKFDVSWPTVINAMFAEATQHRFNLLRHYVKIVLYFLNSSTIEQSLRRLS